MAFFDGWILFKIVLERNLCYSNLLDQEFYNSTLTKMSRVLILPPPTIDYIYINELYIYIYINEFSYIATQS